MRKETRKIILTIVVAFVFSVAFNQEVRAEKKPYEIICNENEWQVLKLTNEERMKEGLEPLSTFKKLQAASNVRAKELITLFSHTRPDGSSCFTAYQEVGSYMTAGENIAAGYSNPSAVVEGWMNSPGHKANILQKNYAHLGVGYTTGGVYGKNWVQNFIGSCQCSSISMDEQTVKQYQQGTTISDMNRYLISQCSHGTCYIPLGDGMCSGYQKNKTGLQTITVTYQGLSTTFRVSIGEDASAEKSEKQTVKKPARVTGLKVKKAGAGKLLLTWKSMKNVNGYEVYMKTGGGSYKKIKTVKGSKKVKMTKKGVKKGTKYIFKVRAYKIADGKKYTGAFSKTKACKP